MFVMISSWRRTSSKLSVEERMGEAFSDAALSITITTVTDILAIGIGATASVPTVRLFCIFAAVVILFDYLYQITFFAACMVLTGRREGKMLHPITCKPVTPASEAVGRSGCFRFWCTGGVSDMDPYNDDDRPEVAAMRFLRDQYGSFITNGIVKVFVFLLYGVYMGIAIYGCTQIRQGLELTKVVAQSSYLTTDINNWDRYYREYNQPTYIVVKEKHRYWLKEDRDKMDRMLEAFESTERFHGRNITRAWTRDFDDYITKENIVVDQFNFMDILQQAFLIEPKYSLYKDSIEFNDEKDDILTSRFLMYPKDLFTPIRQMDSFTEAVKVRDSLNMDIEVVNEFFTYYESWVSVLPALIQNFGIAAASILFVCLFLIPNPLCSVYVALSIISICVGIIGYMTFWGVNVDSVSQINIIMAVGLSVDFTAHLTYAFSTAKGADKNERVREALYGLGVPILQAAVSTILGLLFLADPFAYIFEVFFVTMFLTMTFGALHGLVFIPVVLSLIGPSEDCCSGCPTDTVWTEDTSKDPPPGYTLHSMHRPHLARDPLQVKIPSHIPDYPSPYWSNSLPPNNARQEDVLNPVIFSNTPYKADYRNSTQPAMLPVDGQWMVSKRKSSPDDGGQFGFNRSLLSLQPSRKDMFRNSSQPFTQHIKDMGGGYWTMQYHSAYELNRSNNQKDEDDNSDIYDRDMFVNTAYERDQNYKWIPR